MRHASNFYNPQASSAKEINHLMRILGLKYGVDYSMAKNRKTLRYGGIIILTDQVTPMFFFQVFIDFIDSVF